MCAFLCGLVQGEKLQRSTHVELFIVTILLGTHNLNQVRGRIEVLLHIANLKGRNKVGRWRKKGKGRYVFER
jgi:hypothetical protein